MAKNPPPPPDPMQQPPRWKVPTDCANCGAKVDQALQSRADQPRCRFCNEPLPCEALPPPAAPLTGFESLMGGLVQSAMGSAMAQQQQMSEQWMQNLSQPGALAAMSDPFVHGRATVADFKDLGSETNEGRLFLVTLDVRLPAGNPYRASVSSAVPQDVGYKLQPGTEVAIRVLMSAKEDVKVDWRSP
jgi:hypothetical protein